VAIEILRPLKEKYLTVFALFIILILLFEPQGLVAFIERAVIAIRRRYLSSKETPPPVGKGEAIG
jgi:hypothetical protein